MFVDAYDITRQFTMPVIMSHKNKKDECFSGIGAFVVINNEGWCVTAGHIVAESNKLINISRQVQNKEKQVEEIRNDTNLAKKERSKKLKLLPEFDGAAPTNVSIWWGWDNITPEKVILFQHNDLAFLKLSNFDSTLISKYPKFKNPDSILKPGKSLCRIGFPFSTIKPTFNDSNNSFILPSGSLPLPLFPNEGIFTRTVIIKNNTPEKESTFEHLYLETSSPGLRGQSGGPIFDADGNIWAIQSQTRHYPLGFSPDVPNGKKGEKEHQFMNIGWGVHVATIIGAMKDLGINFEISED